MKKNNQKGFVLAETLIVTVFLMVLFAMIYRNFFPLVGEYEKREVYDDVDGKYGIYWIKEMVESAVYSIDGDDNRKYNMQTYHYVRFNCQDLMEVDSKQVCNNIVHSLQVNGCDLDGNNCDIFITNYAIGDGTTNGATFKNTVKQTDNELLRYRENCSSTDSACKQLYSTTCDNYNKKYNTFLSCSDMAVERVFSDGFKDYIVSLPDYTTRSLNDARYRVIVIFHNVKDNNNYYSYATIEVIH